MRALSANTISVLLDGQAQKVYLSLAEFQNETLYQVRYILLKIIIFYSFLILNVKEDLPHYQHLWAKWYTIYMMV